MMLVLSADNKTVDTNNVDTEFHYSVLSFRDYKNPDFYMEPAKYLEEFNSAAITLFIGPFTIVMPLPWSILCNEIENVESIPLCEAGGRNYSVFVINPIDGYMPHFFRLKTGTIFPSTTWTCVPLDDKDMLTVPLGKITHNDATVERGPVCAIFSPSKMEINKPISDIW